MKVYSTLIQGTDEWLDARCGLITASEMKLIVTPTFKAASNDRERAHLYELLAQRITRYVEPRYVNSDMLRGHTDEIEARALYARNYNEVQEVGFITNDAWGFTLGYSPDGLVGDDGLIEIKSRAQKFQTETIISGEMPSEYMLQVQTGMLVSGRRWCDFISYCGGMPMMTIRVYPDPVIRAAILTAAEAFEERLIERLRQYLAAIDGPGMIPTERLVELEMHA